MSTVIYVVDDDESMRRALSFLLRAEKYAVESFASARDILAKERAVGSACLVSDIRMPDMDGLELQKAVAQRYPALPVIIMTGHGDVPLAVRAMGAGAIDFLEKPFENEHLLSSIARALEQGRSRGIEEESRRRAVEAVSRLTLRERDVLDLLVAGDLSKVIAHKLGISHRTVEVHRVHIMEKMQARTVADLVRMALASRRPV
jgi:two-component system response regulator FixJ